MKLEIKTQKKQKNSEINKMYKSPARVMKEKKKGKEQITSIRNQRGDITTDSTDIKTIFLNITSYFRLINLRI